MAEDGTYEAKVKVPSGGTAGVIFGYSSTYVSLYVDITTGTSNNVRVRSKLLKGSFASTTLATGSASISAGSWYTLRVCRLQRHVEYSVLNASDVVLATVTYDADADFAPRGFGVIAFNTNVAFDDYRLTRLDQLNAPAGPRWTSTAQTTLSANALQVDTRAWGGAAKLEWAGDADYLVEAAAGFSSKWIELQVRHSDPDNYYAVRVDDNANTAYLYRIARGKRVLLDQGGGWFGSSSPVTVEVHGDRIRAWVNGTPMLTATDGSLSAGGVALASSGGTFSSVQVGYDANTNGAFDGGESLVVDEDFGSTSITTDYDSNGNLTYDGTYKYTYDAWNRLVKATLNDTDVVIQSAEFDGLGRRIRKTVTNSGDLDGVTVYLYNGQQIIETRDGSGP